MIVQIPSPFSRIKNPNFFKLCQKLFILIDRFQELNATRRIHELIKTVSVIDEIEFLCDSREADICTLTLIVPYSVIVYGKKKIKIVKLDCCINDNDNDN